MSGLLVATGSGLLRVEGGEVDVLLARPGVQCVAVDGGRILAGSRGSGLWESEEGGVTWSDAELPATDVFSVAFSPADGAVYAGCEPSALYVRRDGGAWLELSTLRELPSAPTWSFPPRPWTSHVRWIAPSPHDAGLILVGIELGGLMRTTDGGETWADHRPGAQRDVHSLAWHPRDARRAYEAGGGGAAWSEDGGDSWLAADEGRDRNYTWSVAVDPDDPELWYVSASTGPYAAHGGRDPQALIYGRLDGEWRALAGGLPDPLPAMPYALVAHEGGLVAGLADGQLWGSEDRGVTWERYELEGDPLTELHALVRAA
jgi:photosystem II stability/assembly factor-like uncharacterized protein